MAAQQASTIGGGEHSLATKTDQRADGAIQKETMAINSMSSATQANHISSTR